MKNANGPLAKAWVGMMPRARRARSHARHGGAQTAPQIKGVWARTHPRRIALRSRTGGERQAPAVVRIPALCFDLKHKGYRMPTPTMTS